MARTGSRFAGRKSIRRVAWLALFALTALACPRATFFGEEVWAQDFAISAKVDKTTVMLGEPVDLTLTLTGELSGVEVPTFQFPEGFVVAGRSQSTNVTIRSGAMERSMSLLYRLVPQRAGTFQLGPFEVKRLKKAFKTEAIEVTVSKPALSPNTQPQGERFTL